jgi:dihydrodipicolinate synthase/N-acetylneuraminate lyase
MVGGLPLGFKAALARMGICEPWPAPPLQALTEQQILALDPVLDRHGLRKAPAGLRG